MGEIQTHKPVLLIAAVISRYPAAIDWVRDQSRKLWGPIGLESPSFDFSETDFYAAAMGRDLKKRFVAFRDLIEADSIAVRKLQSNQWEAEYAAISDHSVLRPLNVDPGYISEAKLVLATTKDRDHRIYLRDGIFAEVTLHFHQGKWRSSRWTYPDYQRADFQAFFTECRNLLRSTYRTANP
jgi:hypothetical protein